MPFCFEITEVIRARRPRPIVCLVGWLREGNMRTSDAITVPYTDGTSVSRAIIAIEAQHKWANKVNAEEFEEEICIAISDVEITRVQIGGVATGFRSS